MPLLPDANTQARRSQRPPESDDAPHHGAVATMRALSRCVMPEQSRHAVEVRSAITAVTPGAKAALICSAVAALTWAGRGHDDGRGAQVFLAGHVFAAPSARKRRRAVGGAASRRGWPRSGQRVADPQAHGRRIGRAGMSLAVNQRASLVSTWSPPRLPLSGRPWKHTANGWRTSPARGVDADRPCRRRPGDRRLPGPRRARQQAPPDLPARHPAGRAAEPHRDLNIVRRACARAGLPQIDLWPESPSGRS